MILLMQIVARTVVVGCGVIALALVVGACQSDIVTPLDPEIRPTSFDDQAGAWTPMLVADSAFYPSIPAAVFTETQQTLDSIVALSKNASSADKDDIRLWNSGSVLRWNSIACDLVAQYNVAPFPERSPNGSFTGRFITDPMRPFATPPFAARLYALLSVAHYDALVHCWRLKASNAKQFPADRSPEFGGLAPQTSSSSWPSEDAALAAASRAILTALFPQEAAKLNAHAASAKRSRLLAGRAWPSDIEAGDSIGVAIARRVMAHAASDGMAAANDQVLWATIEPTLTTSWPRWRSVEIPMRAPMLPLFGRVKTWNVVSVSALDPGPPPVEGSDRWNKDLQEMRDLTKSRTREQVRIANFWEDGGGTATPPGHWCSIAKEQLRINQFSPIRMARVLAYLSTAMHDAAVVGWDIKYRYVSPRPHAVDPSITMSAGLPNFPGYISGHSVFSASAATVLSHFFPSRASEFTAMANEAGDSRVFSRIHFRIDCEVGIDVGNKVGAAAVAKAAMDTP